jgi:hypothetical protein
MVVAGLQLIVSFGVRITSIIGMMVIVRHAYLDEESIKEPFSPITLMAKTTTNAYLIRTFCTETCV